MRRSWTIAATLIAAVVLGWSLWSSWLSLDHGYSIGVDVAGRSQSIYQVEFPTWRKTAHLLLSVAILITLALYVVGRDWARAAAWSAFGAASLIGLLDVAQYGTLGSPTSIWTVLVLLLFSLLSSFVRVRPQSSG